MRRRRVDYDAIAHLYDSQPYRARILDRQLGAVAAAHGGNLAALDIGCGTGSQLIANRAALPALRCVGLDRSLGMLKIARRKAPGIAWVAADAATLPLADASFDYASCQFAFHHIEDKTGMLAAVLRVLRPGGRFVLHNICPQRSPDWLYYEYFAEARDRDFEDFWPAETIVESMKAAGYAAIDVSFEQIEFIEDLPAWLATVRRRDTCSQLQAISDAAYRRGLERLERELADPNAPRSCVNRLCLMTICATAPPDTGVTVFRG